MPVRVGVIGVGYLGQHHARIYSGLDDVELVAVADSDKDRADTLARKYDCGSFTRGEDILGLCDAISIVTPTVTHHKIALDCLRAGKDLLVEKPITGDVSSAKDLFEEAEKRNLILQVGHLERYNPAVVAAAELVENPRFIEAERLSPFQGRGTDVDVTLDLMIHDIEIVLSMTRSALKDIRAFGQVLITDKFDIAKAWLEFEDGCKAMITASRVAPEKERKLRMFQRDEYIAVDYQRQEVKRYFRDGSGMGQEAIKPEKREPLHEELKDFISCVEGRRKPRVSGLEAMNALDVALKITEMLNSADYRIPEKGHRPQYFAE
jgi:predicted dehydrogenase